MKQIEFDEAMHNLNQWDYEEKMKLRNEEMEAMKNKHIQYQLKSDTGEVAGVAFQFPVHGIFREYGVGNGTPRALVGKTSRTMSDWLSGTLAKSEGKLLDIVAEHSSNKVVRTFIGVKK